MNLSILIPTLEERKHFLNDLLLNLKDQINVLNVNDKIEILIDNSPKGISIGTKRNNLLSISKGKYTCFIDDDDMIASDYVNTIMEGINSDKDCISLKGLMTIDGRNPEIFEHSIKYKEYKTTSNDIKYERFPNHLNTIKSSISKQFKFKESNWGEDTDWAKQIFNSGLIKSEYYTDKILYYYKYRSRK